MTILMGLIAGEIEMKQDKKTKMDMQGTEY